MPVRIAQTRMTPHNTDSQTGLFRSDQSTRRQTGVAMAKTMTFSLRASERIWLPFLHRKRQRGGAGFRIGRFCEAALREALPEPDSSAAHRLGAIEHSEPGLAVRTRAFRGDPGLRQLLLYWQMRLKISRQDIIITAIRRKQECARLPGVVC